MYAGGGVGGRDQRKHRQLNVTGTMVRHLKDRIFKPELHGSPSPVLCAASASSLDMVSPAACVANASTSICSRFMHSSFFKERCPVNSVVWTPDGRRLLAGGNNGMLTLWSGEYFVMELPQQAHEAPIRCLVWSHSGEWLVSADNNGAIKYWTPTLNLSKDIADAHPSAPVRDLSFSPTDAKFVSCADDATVKVWDFDRGSLDRVLGSPSAEGAIKSHGWDAKATQWHPTKGLIVSSSKDHVTKLWDPRVSAEICSLHLHKNACTCLRWHASGNFFASGARDQAVKLFDLRAMREYATLKGHKREVSALAWHPTHAELLASASHDGTLYYWSTLQTERPIGVSLGARGNNAHEREIWTLAWHPFGHLLCSGGNDNLVKFWSRNRPGEGRKREREDADEVFDDEVEMRMQTLANMAT